uniref:Sulfotransferase domain-containing protein n=1 Tax=Strongyloides stercoralis TaxID=6248 RepID=A0A0K0DZT1_STRER
MNFLNILFLTFLTQFLISLTNEYVISCKKRFGRTKYCNIFFEIASDSFFQKVGSLFLPGDYANLMALYRRSQLDSKYIVIMNYYIENHVDQHTIQLICKFYGLKYKKPTYIRLYISRNFAKSMNNQKENTSGSRRRWFSFRSKN